MTTYAKNAGKINTGTVKPDVPYPGKVLRFTDEFTATGSDNYVIAKVQKCDIITGGYISWSAPTNSMAVTVGDDRDCDRYVLSFTTAVASDNTNTGSYCGYFNARTGVDFQHTGACDIFININTGGTGSNSVFKTWVDIIRP